MIIPMRADLVIRRNDNPFRVDFTAANLDGSAYNFTGHAARLQIRADPGDGVAPPLLAVDNTMTGASRLSVGAASLEVVFAKANITSIPTATPPSDDVLLAYDLLVTPPGGDENAWFYGQVTVKAGVTI